VPSKLPQLNMRISPEAFELLDRLHQHFGCSRVRVIIRALRTLARLEGFLDVESPRAPHLPPKKS